MVGEMLCYVMFSKILRPSRSSYIIPQIPPELYSELGEIVPADPGRPAQYCYIISVQPNGIPYSPVLKESDATTWTIRAPFMVNLRMAYVTHMLLFCGSCYRSKSSRIGLWLFYLNATSNTKKDNVSVTLLPVLFVKFVYFR